MDLLVDINLQRMLHSFYHYLNEKEELLELILQHEMNHVPVQLIHLPLTLIFN